MVKRYQYKEDEHAGMVCEPSPSYGGAALAEPEIACDEDYSGLPCSHTIEEVRATVIRATEHIGDPNYWTTWEDMEARLRKKYPEWNLLY